MSHQFIAAITGLVLTVSVHGSDMGSLLERSPFLPKGYAEKTTEKRQPPAQQKSPPSWELRGWTRMGDKTQVSLYNRTEKKSKWITVGDTNSEVRVLGLDSDSRQVRIAIDGKPETLELKETTLASAAAAPVKPAPTTRPAPPKPSKSNIKPKNKKAGTDAKKPTIPRRRVIVPRRIN